MHVCALCIVPSLEMLKVSVMQGKPEKHWLQTDKCFPRIVRMHAVIFFTIGAEIRNWLDHLSFTVTVMQGLIYIFNLHTYVHIAFCMQHSEVSSDCLVRACVKVQEILL
jgi:hypothetical protein